MARTHKGRGRKRSAGRRGSAIPPAHTRTQGEERSPRGRDEAISPIRGKVSNGGLSSMAAEAASAQAPVHVPLRTRVRTFVLRLLSFS